MFADQNSGKRISFPVEGSIIDVQAYKYDAHYIDNEMVLKCLETLVNTMFY
nr:hypothetical protein [Mycoplasmopsis bovis]